MPTPDTRAALVEAARIIQLAADGESRAGRVWVPGTVWLVEVMSAALARSAPEERGEGERERIKRAFQAGYLANGPTDDAFVMEAKAERYAAIICDAPRLDRAVYPLASPPAPAQEPEPSAPPVAQGAEEHWHIWEERTKYFDGFNLYVCDYGETRVTRHYPPQASVPQGLPREEERECDELRTRLVTALNMLSTFRDHIATPELLEQDAEEIDAFLREDALARPVAGSEERVRIARDLALNLQTARDEGFGGLRVPLTFEEADEILAALRGEREG